MDLRNVARRWHPAVLAVAAAAQAVLAEHHVERLADGTRRYVYEVRVEEIVPRSADSIAAELNRIRSAPVETAGRTAIASQAVVAAVENRRLHRERENAMRELMVYRYLADVPYRDLVLDRTCIAYAEAASQLMTQAGQMSHTPPNPGMPEHEYQFGFRGTSSSNILSSPAVVESVKFYMHDSDDSNIDRLGHRRWCLNPAMSRTGFGGSGNFSAMWSFDQGRSVVPDYQYIAYPPRGLMPMSLFEERQAWSVVLNPAKYRRPERGAVAVGVYPASLDAVQGRLYVNVESLPLDYFNVNHDGFGVPNCIIFRPAGLKVEPARGYWIQLAGIKTTTGPNVDIGYYVEFFDLKGVLKKEEKKTARESLSARRWTDSSGRYHADADLEEIEESVVRLRKADGVVIRVRLDRLSPGDQDFVRARTKAIRARGKTSDQAGPEGLALCRAGNWTAGLSALGRSADPSLAAVARLDLSQPDPTDNLDEQDRKMNLLVAGWRAQSNKYPHEDHSWMVARSEYWRTRADLGRLVQWAEGMLGQKIGNGQCTEVATYAMRAAHSTTREGWERRLAETEAAYPGDILRLVSARAPGFWTGVQHLLVIKRVVEPKHFEAYHQNWNGRQQLTVGDFDLSTLQSGSYEIYRPQF